MYEQKQIILDGEILGNNVIINRYFYLIYNISPLIIKNFITIINKTDFLSKPIRIKKYDFIENNCINIHFKSKSAIGEVHLAYILNKNNELQLDASNLIITNGENKGFTATKQYNEFKLMDSTYPQKEISQNSNNNVDQSITIEPIKNTNADILENTLKCRVEDCLKESFELNNLVVEEEEKEEIVVDNELNNNVYMNDNREENHSKEFLSEENIIETKKAIYNQNINRAKSLVNSEKKNLSNESIENKISFKNDFQKRNTNNEDFTIYKDTPLSIDEQEDVLLKGNEEFDINENKIEEVKNTNTSEILDKMDKSETIDVNEEIDLDEKIDSLNNFDLNKDNEISEINEIETLKNKEDETILDITEVNNTNFEQLTNENIETIVSTYDCFNNIEFVDFFDVIPKVTDDYLEEISDEEIDNIELIAEDNKIPQENQQSNNSDFKKNKKNRKLNRMEKIALYQNILKGYDNKMTENKLNKFKEDFKLIHKEDKVSIEDVLDAQVELLVDNNSKAFRILGDDTKQDVIQIDKELFLSKDKIYTWGDVYLLDYKFD